MFGIPETQSTGSPGIQGACARAAKPIADRDILIQEAQSCSRTTHNSPILLSSGSWLTTTAEAGLPADCSAWWVAEISSRLPPPTLLMLLQHITSEHYPPIKFQIHRIAGSQTIGNSWMLLFWYENQDQNTTTCTHVYLVRKHIVYTFRTVK